MQNIYIVYTVNFDRHAGMYECSETYYTVWKCLGICTDVPVIILCCNVSCINCRSISKMRSDNIFEKNYYYFIHYVPGAEEVVDMRGGWADPDLWK